MSEQPLNQTGFVQDESLRESPQTVESVESQVVSESQEPKVRLKKTKLLLLLALGVFFILIFIIVAFVLLRRMQVEPGEEIRQEEVEEEQIANDELSQKIQEIKLSLEKADPAIDEIPFPAIDAQTMLFPIAQE